MLKKIAFVLFLSCFAYLAQASAQTAVSDEKIAAVKELVNMTNPSDDSEGFLKSICAEMQQSSLVVVKAMLEENKDLSEADKKSFLAQYIKDAGTREARYNERLFQKLNFIESVNEMQIHIFDKFYTLEEIKDMIAFYKTPTGQKTLLLKTPVMLETMKQMQEKIIPKIPAIMKELNDEDAKEFREKLNQKKSKSSKTDS
jgi:hypothetical protein